MNSHRSTVLWIAVAILVIAASLGGLFWSDFYELDEAHNTLGPADAAQRDAWEAEPTVNGTPATTYEQAVDPNEQDDER